MQQNPQNSEICYGFSEKKERENNLLTQIYKIV